MHTPAPSRTTHTHMIEQRTCAPGPAAWARPPSPAQRRRPRRPRWPAAAGAAATCPRPRPCTWKPATAPWPPAPLHHHQHHHRQAALIAAARRRLRQQLLRKRLSKEHSSPLSLARRGSTCECTKQARGAGICAPRVACHVSGKASPKRRSRSRTSTLTRPSTCCASRAATLASARSICAATKCSVVSGWAKHVPLPRAKGSSGAH